MATDLRITEVAPDGRVRLRLRAPDPGRIAGFPLLVQQVVLVTLRDPRFPTGTGARVGGDLRGYAARDLPHARGAAAVQNDLAIRLQEVQSQLIREQESAPALAPAERLEGLRLQAVEETATGYRATALVTGAGGQTGRVALL